MKSNRKLWLAIVLVLIALGVTYVSYRVEVAHHRDVDEVDREAMLLQEVASAPEAAESPLTLHLFRPGSLDPGVLNERQIEDAIVLSGEPEARIHKIAVSVLQHFDDVLPPRASVRRAYLLDDGTAVIDFSREIGQQLMGGIGTELALLQSVARTLTTNHPQVKQVRFLVDGQERPTLSGHVSIQVPFM